MRPEESTILMLVFAHYPQTACPGSCRGILLGFLLTDMSHSSLAEHR